MMPALHQNLRPAKGDGLLDLPVHFAKSDDIGIQVFFRAIKRAELAIDIADIGIIDIAINDVGDDPVPASVVCVGTGKLPPSVSERAQLLKRQKVKALC